MMNMSERLQRQLGALGFTEYEARVYLALLQHHAASGYQLSKASGVPRSMVYEALGRLAQRGAILTLPEDAKGVRYAPLPPHELVAQMRQQFETCVDGLAADLTALAVPAEPAQIWNISGDAQIVQRAQAMIDAASAELYVGLHDRTLAPLQGALTAAQQRGVAVHALLFGENTLTVGEVRHHPQAETAVHRVGRGIVIVVADRQAALIGGTTEAASAAWTTNPHLVFVAREYIWQELFTQRLGQELPVEMLAHLAPLDRAVLGRE
jgi:Cd2+/Zn2+-exporting ATPase